MTFHTGMHKIPKRLAAQTVKGWQKLLKTQPPRLWETQDTEGVRQKYLKPWKKTQSQVGSSTAPSCPHTRASSTAQHTLAGVLSITAWTPADHAQCWGMSPLPACPRTPVTKQSKHSSCTHACSLRDIFSPAPKTVSPRLLKPCIWLQTHYTGMSEVSCASLSACKEKPMHCPGAGYGKLFPGHAPPLPSPRPTASHQPFPILQQTPQRSQSKEESCKYHRQQRVSCAAQGRPERRNSRCGAGGEAQDHPRHSAMRWQTSCGAEQHPPPLTLPSPCSPQVAPGQLAYGSSTSKSLTLHSTRTGAAPSPRFLPALARAAGAGG